MSASKSALTLCALLMPLASPALAAESGSFGALSKTAPGGEMRSETGVHGTRSLNQVRVDGVKSTQTSSSAVEVGVKQAFSWGSLSLNAAQLLRDIDDQRMNSTSEKSTAIITPSVSARVTPSLTVTAGFSVYRTRVENDVVQDDAYRLNTQRSQFRGAWQDGGDLLSLTLASEARAERQYDIGGYPMVDRDYIPAQAELGYLRQVNGRLSVSASTRYSHYNDDVYKDMYDTDVPSSPTLAQVFDYLLSFKAAALYTLTPRVGLSTELGRKAALDTDSFTGDEYLVGLSGGIGAAVKVAESATIGLKGVTSSGRKTHTNQGQKYDYANRLNTAVASVTVAM